MPLSPIATKLTKNGRRLPRALQPIIGLAQVRRAPSDQQIAAAIRPSGLYNMKARNIHKFCEAFLADPVWQENLSFARITLQYLPVNDICDYFATTRKDI